MKGHSKIRDFVVGIDYANPCDNDDNHSHMTLRRRVNLEELIDEIRGIFLHGCTYPQFPPEAKPSITYAWDLSSTDDGDIYHELKERLEERPKEQTKKESI